MISDAPRYVKVQQTDNETSVEDEANKIENFFQSNLKQ